jgi:hypothetical protein
MELYNSKSSADTNFALYTIECFVVQLWAHKDLLSPSKHSDILSLSKAYSEKALSAYVCLQDEKVGGRDES